MLKPKDLYITEKFNSFNGSLAYCLATHQNKFMKILTISEILM